MNGIEILINGIVNIGLAIVLFVYIDRKDYPIRKTKIFFLIPLWSMFLGFYYLRNYLDGNYFETYWRVLRVFEIVTNSLFIAFFYYKNQILKK